DRSLAGRDDAGAEENTEYGEDREQGQHGADPPTTGLLTRVPPRAAPRAPATSSPPSRARPRPRLGHPRLSRSTTGRPPTRVVRSPARRGRRPGRAAARTGRPDRAPPPA